MQSRLHSIIEVCTGTATGFLGSWLIAYLVFNLSTQNLSFNVTLCTVLCTVWSLVRGYAVRRWFATQHPRSVPLPPSNRMRTPSKLPTVREPYIWPGL